MLCVYSTLCPLLFLPVFPVCFFSNYPYRVFNLLFLLSHCFSLLVPLPTLSFQLLVAVSPLFVFSHLFSGAGHEKRRGEHLKWSVAFRLYIGSFPCAQLPGPVHTAQLGRVFFCVFSLGLCFVCSFVLFDLFVCMSPFFYVSLGS